MPYKYTLISVKNAILYPTDSHKEDQASHFPTASITKEYVAHTAGINLSLN